GTTVDWCGGIARGAKGMLAPQGHALDWTAVAHPWRREYQPAMDAGRAGHPGHVVLDRLPPEMLAPVLPRDPRTRVSQDQKAHLALGWRRLDPWPDVIEGMERLKRKFILAAVSNANIALAVEMAKRGGLPWDVILGAELVRMYKPRPEVYDSVASFLGLEPVNVMMVACHDWDLAGAAARGLRAAYVRRPDEWGPGAAPRAAAPGTYDVQVASFIALADRLGA